MRSVARLKYRGIGLLQLALPVFTVFLTAGCATYQGMPQQQVELVLSVSSVQGNEPPTWKQQLDYTKGDRNDWIERNLIEVDRAYNQFVVEMQQSRSGWGIGTGILDLAFGVASSLTPSAGVKANYAAASTLLSGSYAVINKEAFLEKTISALVAAMDARRKTALIQIRRGMQLDEDAYPLSAAHADLLEYQRASSLVGGLSFVESAAEKQIEAAEDEIEEIRPISAEEGLLRDCMTDTLESLQETDHAKLLAAIQELQPEFPDERTIAELVDAFKMTRFNPDPVYERRIHGALSRAGLIGNRCGD